MIMKDILHLAVGGCVYFNLMQVAFALDTGRSGLEKKRYKESHEIQKTFFSR